MIELFHGYTPCWRQSLKSLSRSCSDFPLRFFSISFEIKSPETLLLFFSFLIADSSSGNVKSRFMVSTCSWRRLSSWGCSPSLLCPPTLPHFLLYRSLKNLWNRMRL